MARLRLGAGQIIMSYEVFVSFAQCLGPVSTFDPYQVWLDISPHERPVNYYRLLGLPLLESDPQRVAAAAQRTTAHVEQFRSGPQAAYCDQVLSDIQVARDCLLDPTRKRAYDGGLQGQTSGPARDGATAPPAQGKIASPGAERQIAFSPPVPTGGGGSDSRGGDLPMAAPAASPPHGAYPISGPPSPASAAAAQNRDTSAPLSTTRPSVPLGQGAAGSPHHDSASDEAQRAGSAPLAQPVAATAMATPVATPVPPTEPSAAPPSWAPADRTGEVRTVAAAEQDSAAAARATRGRQLRRRQGKHSAYMLMAVAMAVIVLFFGVVAALAVFYDG